MSCTGLSIRLLNNSSWALQRSTVSGWGAWNVVFILLLLCSTGNASPVDEPLFGITVRNASLERRFQATRTEQEEISKVILSSDVQGEQTTTTETRLRILPDSGSIRFDLISTGDVISRTTSINRQVMIDGVGKYRFNITKPFWFDGTRFLTQPGYGTIQANQFPQRVVSAVGAAMPLLSPLTDRVAWEQVSRQQAQINQAVAEDVSQDVLPKINRITDEKFALLGEQLAIVRAQAEASLNTMPFSWTARSTDATFSIAAMPQRDGVSSSSFNGTTVPMPPLVEGEDVAIMMSESVATALLEQYVPGGMLLTDTQIEKATRAWSDMGEQKWSTASVLQLMQDLERYSASEPSLFSIELAKVRPIAVRFYRGDVCIETAFQIVPQIGAPSGGMKMTWRLHGRGVSADQWAVAVHRIDVGDVGETTSISRTERDELRTYQPELRIPIEGGMTAGDFVPAEPEVTTVQSGTVWVSVVKNAAESLVEKIPPVTLPRELDLQQALPGSARARLVRIESADGVLRAAFRFVDVPAAPSFPQDSGACRMPVLVVK